MSERGSGPANEILLLVEGVLDPMAATDVRSRIARADPASTVILDFSRVRAVQDLGLAVLAHGLAACRSRVRLRGLSLRHERMLRYLGFDATALP